MTLLSSARQSRSLGAVFSRSERNSSTERSTRLTMSVPRVALSMAPTVPNPAHTRKNYRSHDQVAVALEFSVAIAWCRGWISTRFIAHLAPGGAFLLAGSFDTPDLDVMLFPGGDLFVSTVYSGTVDLGGGP